HGRIGARHVGGAGKAGVEELLLDADVALEVGGEGGELRARAGEVAVEEGDLVLDELREELLVQVGERGEAFRGHGHGGRSPDSNATDFGEPQAAKVSAWSTSPSCSSGSRSRRPSRPPTGRSPPTSPPCSRRSTGRGSTPASA